MKCHPTQTPPDIDIPSLREKYHLERDKRIRREGTNQYVPTDDVFQEAYEEDPYLPVVPRRPISEDTDVVVLGAGWAGIQATYHLRQAGVNHIRVIDHAGDFGGVWYWNRYPGLQCDNDAYCYLPLLEETGYVPSKQFADGFEIYEHFRRIANQFGLYDGALFHTRVRSMRWDDGRRRWRIGTNRGDDIQARFVVIASGPLNRPKLPIVPGIREFRGRMFHTSRWDYSYTGGDNRNPILDKLADKRVAILGTGATAVQAIPHLARYAQQVYVVQRTPTNVDERHNPPTDPEWVKALRPGWQKERRANFHRAAIDGLLPGEQDLICDIWTEIGRNLQAKFHAQGWPQLTFEQIMGAREAEDYRVMERIRRRIETIVKDKRTAEALKPWYRHLCKRPCSSNDYLESFNRPNVKLLDVSSTRGLERMTPNGIVAGDLEYEIDCMIFASGYEVTSELHRRWGIDVIEGRKGLSLYDYWAEGYRTLHGMSTHGFPNQFYIGFYQGGFNASTTATFSLQGHHIAHIVKEALARGATMVEPSQQAQDDWVRTIRSTAVDISLIARECTPSYFNSEGEEKFRWYLGETYGPGYDAFDRLLQQWRAAGTLEGLILDTGRH